jgi:hypothetical protein
VTTVNNGRDAVAAALCHPFDIVLMDGMPAADIAVLYGTWSAPATIWFSYVLIYQEANRVALLSPQCTCQRLVGWRQPMQSARTNR